MKRELYKSSDYSGLRTKEGIHFYYGYEHTSCRSCGPDKSVDDCEKCEWAFIVEDKNQKEKWRCSTSTIEKAFPNSFDGSQPTEAYLLAGIGLYLETINLRV